MELWDTEGEELPQNRRTIASVEEGKALPKSQPIAANDVVGEAISCVAGFI
jgi:hypothetical protein